MVKITVSFPGASAEEIDETVVEPIRSALVAVEDVGRIDCSSSAGSAEIFVRPIPGGDARRLLDRVLGVVEKIDSSLPAEASLAVQAMPERE
jgi:multidrug efflux pump subunit AcrB